MRYNIWQYPGAMKPPPPPWEEAVYPDKWYTDLPGYFRLPIRHQPQLQPPPVETVPWYHASTMTVTEASSVSGTVEDTRAEDASEVDVAEAAAQNFKVDFSFGILNDPVPIDTLAFSFTGYYDGNPTHNVKLKQWNFTSSEWDDVTTNTTDFPDAASEATYRFSLFSRVAGEDYLSGGEIRLRIEHTSSGSIGHNLYIDHLHLEAVTIDKWGATFPSYLPRQESIQPNDNFFLREFAEEVVTLDKWYSRLPGYFPRPERYQPIQTFYADHMEPEVITLDKWYSILPSYFPRPLDFSGMPVVAWTELDMAPVVVPDFIGADFPSYFPRPVRQQPAAVFFKFFAVLPPTNIGAIEFPIGHGIGPAEVPIGHDIGAIE